MILRIYSIRDEAANAYLQPFFLHTNKLAERAFSDCVQDSKHRFGEHPEDYTLFYLGEFDDDSGQFEVRPVPEKLANGGEFVTWTATKQHDMFQKEEANEIIEQ